ncbi:hypothetical protein [Salisediminibacterium halotolerans]|uniref:DUF8042 domain-containing protein n=1 Tax=Salisediminibacterium halotolerans TaxID=517425 RepID=A0A1H9VJQ1_9BACI|nr:MULTISPECIES: hypothetical protein [Salisediminibacterium]RLJ75519.1 hypothetical protein BCL39_1035 [Actinophytocola xinjiangensis]RPE89372.1 hypothetical protein EDD67_0148 [Salisediminibacterium halotolerans]TWG36132.1 hypothetical protein BCL52_1033 [Salisediminibacterium halotolerans]SES21567.1 hypothetical protein SAMN05444126_12112 [Salisediminibacterium haloalkalitolerans]GEL08134.1 hypothetical protein SHA02_15500 [Salisediminibacterium halotolerans]
MKRKDREVCQEVLRLADLLEEELAQLHKQLNDNNLKVSSAMIESVIKRFMSANQEIAKVRGEIDTTVLKSEAMAVQQGFDYVVNAYEEEQVGKVLEIIQFTLKPRVKTWRAKVHDVIGPYAQK